MKYLESHEWATLEGDTAIIGISDHAQSQLSDIVYVDLPAVGDKVSQKERFMSIESVKAASDIYAPLSGEVVEINSALEDSPELINESAQEKGWLVKIKVSAPGEYDGLLSEDQYKEKI